MNPSSTPSIPDALPDLEALRRSEAPRSTRRAGGPWIGRLTVLSVVLGAIAVLAILLQPVFFPPRSVRVAAVRVAEGSTVRTRAGVEAAGWIEADPFPVTVRPLVKGVVEALPLLEGGRVEAGETVVARLRNADLENALTVSQARLALREAEVAEARAHLEKDRAVLDQRLEARALLAEQEGAVRSAKAAAQEAAEAQRQAEAARETARLDVLALDDLEAAGSVTPLSRRRVEGRLAEAEAAARAAAREQERAGAELLRLQALESLAREGVEDPRDLAGRVQEDEAALRRAQAERDLARAELDVAQRNVDLLTVRAPVDGVVLRLEAAPGAMAGPEGAPREATEGATGSTGRLASASGALVSLYDPTRLQARVDVQLSDVGGVGAGTDVELEVEALAGRVFRGVVSRLQHEADLLKNTLQVKVRILDPDPLLRPEMLVRARFLVREEVQDGEVLPPRLLVPAEAVRGDELYLFDPREGGRARRVAVHVVGRRDGFAEVEGPLGPGHKVILDPVRPDEKVREQTWAP